MEYRKLISFGKSSYVMSVPKQWIDTHGLTKGDTLSVEVNETNLVVHPKDAASSDTNKSVTIDADGHNMEVVKRKLIAAYINDADTITITDNDLRDKLDDIKDVISTLVAMETVQQDSTSMKLRSFLNIDDVDVQSTLRKADHILTATFNELLNALNGDADPTTISNAITERDEDMNRMCFLLFRAINHRVNNGAFLEGADPARNILRLWGFTLFMEEIGDELKRIARRTPDLTTTTECNDAAQLLEAANENYQKCMKGMFNDEQELVYDVADKRKRLLHECSETQDAHDNPAMVELCNRLKQLIAKIHTINRMSY